MSNDTATPQAAQTPGVRFIDNGDGTVSDTHLRLMWSRGTLNEREVGYAAAERLCADLRLGGYSDWRLPTIEQLFALADRARSEPAIDTAVFSVTRLDWYWSRTPSAWAPLAYWIVSFGNGLASYTAPDNYLGGYVRASRPLQADG